MKKYIAQVYLVKNGKVIKTGQELQLTDAQAKKLGDKVKPKNAQAANKDNESNQTTSDKAVSGKAPNDEK